MTNRHNENTDKGDPEQLIKRRNRVYGALALFVNTAAGLWFVSRAWRGIDPGRSAAMAFLLGALIMALYVKYTNAEE